MNLLIILIFFRISIKRHNYFSTTIAYLNRNELTALLYYYMPSLFVPLHNTLSIRDFVLKLYLKPIRLKAMALNNSFRDQIAIHSWQGCSNRALYNLPGL